MQTSVKQTNFLNPELFLVHQAQKRMPLARCLPRSIGCTFQSFQDSPQLEHWSLLLISPAAQFFWLGSSIVSSFPRFDIGSHNTDQEQFPNTGLLGEKR